MFTRNLTFICAVAALAGSAMAQDAPERTVAELPQTLEETGERAPAEVPRSSAETEGDIAPSEHKYGIGQPASDEQIAAIDIDVMPDGRGYPAGSGTYADGEVLYEEICAACHGSDLAGIAELGAPGLIGGRDTLASDKPFKTIESYWPYASTVYDYIYRAMPMTAPGTLSPDEVYAISAYVLGKAGIIDAAAETTLDAASMTEIVMPNAEGFVPDPRPDTGE